MRIKSSLLAATLGALLALTACHQDVPVLPGSGGKTCEIIVITPKTTWNGSVGDSLRAFFGQIQPALNQPEPRFSLVQIDPRAFNESTMFQHHRNVMIVEIDPAVAESKFEARQDEWAFPQMVVKFSVPSVAAFNELYTPRKAQMLALFYMKEYQRIQKVFAESEQTDITERLRHQYGFRMIFPDGFAFADAKKDFGWIRKESKDYGQGIIFSVMPYKSVHDFDLKSIIEKRDAMCRLVPGPAEGSYMTTELRWEEFYPQSKVIDLNGLYAVETRGLWRLEGDFMGGPFVNYLIADTARGRLVMVDAYLYSPRKPKRDLLLQMEGIARSFKLSPPAIPAATLNPAEE